MKTKNQDFSPVQKALALKRHEQPPARFFRAFPHDVLDRINSPQPAGSLPWYERLGLGEDWKPALLVLLGLVVCVVLAVGLVISRKMPKPPASMTGLTPDPAALVYSTADPAAGDPPEGFSSVMGLDDASSNAGSLLAPVRVENSMEPPSPPPRPNPQGPPR